MATLELNSTGERKRGEPRLLVDFDQEDIYQDSANRFLIRRRPTGYTITPSMDLSINGRSVRDIAFLQAGDRIAIGSDLFTFQDRGDQCEQTKIGPAVNQGWQPTIPIPAKLKVVLGREQSAAVYRLRHSHVSRRHAEIHRCHDQFVIRDLGSSNGTYVNRLRISGHIKLSPGDEVGIGPFSFQLTQDGLIAAKNQGGRGDCGNTAESPAGAAVYGVRITRTLEEERTQLLSSVSVSVLPGEFACIIGPSGAGKSTLLKALANRDPVDAGIIQGGSVLFNGLDLIEEFERLRIRIAYVPQHEILFDQLTLKQTLQFTARLRLPSDFTKIETDERIQSVLKTVQLDDCEDRPIRTLSGGQKKRAAVANEMLAEPDLIFLDEVTSGLDELTDGEMMSLFQRIARQGKTVLCVTHNLTHIQRDCDLLICMTRFGRLAFAGKPNEALDYFRAKSISEIFRRLYVATPEMAGNLASRFEQSEFYLRYVVERLALFPAASSEPPASASAATRLLGSRQRTPRVRFRNQLSVLIARYSLQMMLDGRSSLLRACQCSVVALLLCLVFGDLSVLDGPIQTQAEIIGKRLNCGFVIVLSCFWFGCNNSAKEIVKERAIYELERGVVLHPNLYAISKYCPLSLTAAAQSIILLLVVILGSGLPGSLVAWTSICVSMAMTGVATGLMISAIAKSEEFAVGAVPLVLIPQIILAGAMTSVSGITELASQAAIPSYWGYRAVKSIMETRDDNLLRTNFNACLVLAGQGVAALVATMRGLHRRAI